MAPVVETPKKVPKKEPPGFFVLVMASAYRDGTTAASDTFLSLPLSQSIPTKPTNHLLLAGLRSSVLFHPLERR